MTSIMGRVVIWRKRRKSLLQKNFEKPSEKKETLGTEEMVMYRFHLLFLKNNLAQGHTEKAYPPCTM